MYRSRFRLPWLLLALISLLALIPSPLSAQEDDQVTWRTYDVTMEIRPDGTVRVTEDILIAFNGSFSQGHRTIPMDRIENISDVEVSVGRDGRSMSPSEPVDGAFLGSAGTFEAQREGDDFVIDYAFERTSPADGDVMRAVTISYTASGVIRVYPDATPPEQQLRWTAISSDVTATGVVEEARATVLFPEPISQAQLAIDPPATTVEADRVVWEGGMLGSGESLQVAVAFPPITDAAAPGWQADADTFEGRREHIPAVSMLIAMVALVGWVITTLLMVVRGIRDPEVGLVADIIPQRPDDLPAALVGTLVDESLDTKDVLAGLLDLDRQGYIRIYEDESKSSKAKYRIELLRPIAEAASWDQPMLEGLFGEKGKVGKDINLKDRLKKLREKSMSDLTKAYEEELFARGYFTEKPSTTRMRWVGRILLVAFGFALPVGLLALWTQTFTGWMVVPLVLSAIGMVIGLILTMKAAAKTVDGALVAAKWRAYGRYVEDLKKGPTPEKFFEMLAQDLPWAVALGFDSSWTKLADDMSSPTSRSRGMTPVYVGGFGGDRSSGAPSSGGESGGFGGLQGASARTLAAIGGGSAGMFAMLNDAAASFNAGASSGSSSGGGFSGSSSIGSSGGGGHSFS